MILWGQPKTLFGLCSDCPEVEAHAGRMFSRWALPQKSIRPDYQWSVAKHGDGYSVHPPENYRALDPEFELPQGHYSDIHTALLNIEFQAVAVLVGRLEAPLHMHGALLSRDGRGLALIGAKECGKSTLSTFLWTRGWELLSDDGFCFESRLCVRPVPRRVRLRSEGHCLLSEFSPESWPEHDHLEHRPDGTILFQPIFGSATVPLSGLILLTAEEGELEPLDSARATLEFLIHTNSYRLHGINRTLATLSRLLEDVSCFKLGRASLQQQHERLLKL